MQCYQHQDISAVGLCKRCFKAVCPKCTTLTECGLACSESCAQALTEYAQMDARIKGLCGIGEKKSRLPPTSVLYYSFLTTASGILACYMYLKGHAHPEIAIGFTAVFALLAVAGYTSYRRTGFKN